jgi:hypothetical protein
MTEKDKNSGKRCLNLRLPLMIVNHIHKRKEKEQFNASEFFERMYKHVELKRNVIASYIELLKIKRQAIDDEIEAYSLFLYPQERQTSQERMAKLAPETEQKEQGGGAENAPPLHTPKKIIQTQEPSKETYAKNIIIEEKKIPQQEEINGKNLYKGLMEGDIYD